MYNKIRFTIVHMKFALGFLLGIVVGMAWWFQNNNNMSLKVETLISDLDSTLNADMEYAYFEGQKDALNNDIRIQKKDSCYEWIKSPWNSGELARYNPCKE